MFGGRMEWQRWLRGRLSRAGSWTEARASVHSMAVQLSTAGPHAQVLAKMLGGRAQVSELMSGPLAPALLACNSKGKTSDAFRNRQGCVARNEGFCTLLARAHCSVHEWCLECAKNVPGTDVTDSGILRSLRDV